MFAFVRTNVSPVKVFARPRSTSVQINNRTIRPNVKKAVFTHAQFEGCMGNIFGDVTTFYRDN